MAKAMISRTAMRCCNTSVTAKLSQNPFGPMGQFSGSARKNRKTASNRNANGQILAQEKYRLRESSARKPIRNTINPAQLWLYSDHAISAGVLVLNPDCPGTNAAGSDLPSAAACCISASLDLEISFKSGLENLGSRGAKRVTISCMVTRS